MKTEFTDVSQTRKHLTFEVPSDVVEAEMARVAGHYAKAARVPGFRQGHVPTKVIRQRFKEQIHYDVAHELIPRLVGSALRERSLRPIATPDIRDVVLDEGQPLTFLAEFEIVPPIDPGEYTGLALRKPPAVLDAGSVDEALARLRERAATYHPVEDRAAASGDSVLLDLTRTVQPKRLVQLTDEPASPSDTADHTPEALQNVSVEIGAPANPPGFDENLTGLSPGDQKNFTVTYPNDYAVAELAGTTVDYAATVKGIRRKELPPLDDDFAKQISDVDTLDALRERVRHDLQHEAEHEAEHAMRHELLQQLAARLTGDVPAVLVDEEVERRLEEFLRRLMSQGIDPEKANIDWQELRDRQRPSAEASVRSTLVLDEIARREQIDANDGDVEKEIERFAERAGRTPPAVRARLEKEGGLDSVRGGIRREKAMAWLIEKANISN